MEKKFTPGKWSQGVTLNTKITSKWTKEQIESNDLIEKLHVFANFEGFDEGKSRVLVAACTNEHDAKLIASAPDLLKSLNDIAVAGQLALHCGSNEQFQFVELAIKNALSAIKKATD